jgi:GNAT superfamily N-acetyltransferase
MQKDIPTILTLIKELAEYEGYSSAVTATEELLAKTLSFADPSSPTNWSPGHAKTLLTIAPDGRAAGIAFYFNNYSTFAASPGIYLEDIYVRPEYRRRGYGQSMMSVLAKELLTLGGKRLDCVCLTWNETGFAFLKGLGARDSDAWSGLRIDGEHLEKFAKG